MRSSAFPLLTLVLASVTPSSLVAQHLFYDGVLSEERRASRESARTTTIQYPSTLQTGLQKAFDGVVSPPLVALQGEEAFGPPNECDSDFDGAFLGAAIGAAPGIVWTLTLEDFEEKPTALVALIGGIAGFWTGLAIDSRSCS